MSLALLFLGGLGLASAATSETPKLTADCVDAVVFFGRGNDAPYHDDRTTPFIDATCAKLEAQGMTCDYIDIEFDTTLGGDYCTQVGEGDANGVSQITAFNEKCPCTHIILGGYSEGANVVGDVLSGGACAGASTGILSTSAAGKAIAAALVWGNPRHVANESYNYLDGATLQNVARDADSLARLAGYADVLRDYCQSGDPICAGGSNITQHLDYFDLYVEDASDFVVSKIGSAEDLCPASSSSSAAATVAATTSSAAATSTAATVTAAATSAVSSAVTSAVSSAVSSAVTSAVTSAITSSVASASGAASSAASVTGTPSTAIISTIATSSIVASSFANSTCTDSTSTPVQTSTVSPISTPCTDSTSISISSPTTIRTVVAKPSESAYFAHGTGAHGTGAYPSGASYPTLKGLKHSKPLKVAHGTGASYASGEVPQVSVKPVLSAAAPSSCAVVTVTSYVYA